VGIGGILGIGLFSKPLEWLLVHYQVIVLWAFAGAIIGSIPALWQEAETKTRRDQTDWLILGVTLIGSVAFFVALNNWAVQVPATFIGFVLAGALIALGVLVPGLSPSNLLLVLGLYQPMLAGFKQFNLFGVYLPMAIGGILALAIFAKSMDRLLQTAHARVYHFIIGVVLASTAMIVLPPIMDYSGVTLMTIGFAVLGFGLGVWLGAWMSQLEKRYKA
jgi:putative membrane protein